MPKQDGDLWYCNICGEPYTRILYAVSCENGHDVIYVPIKKADLLNLIQYIHTKDDSLLTESLIKSLFKYKAGKI